MNLVYTKTIKINKMIQGIKSNIFTDVKLKVRAGMKFGTADNRMKVVGYEIFIHYFDTLEKDCQIGSERIKRVINQ